MKRRISRRFRPSMTPGIDQLESRRLLSSGFTVVSSPTVAGSSLAAVSAVSATDIWAVGSQGSGSTTLAENFNGTSWSVAPTPNPSGASAAALDGVSALSGNAVWAVGSSSSGPLVEFFNGTSWSIQTTPTIAGGVLTAVTAISPTDVWAVGGDSSGDLIENFNGTTWSIVQAPGSIGDRASLTSISAASSTDIFAVGEVFRGNQLLQFNGTTWTEPTTQITGSAATQAVDAISATDVWVSGGEGLWNFNGTTWTQVAFPDAVLQAISGSAADNVFAVGKSSSDSNGLQTGVGTAAEQWNGTSWSAVASANPGDVQDGLTGVTTLSSGLVVAVGNANPGGGIIESATFPVSPPVNPIATTTALAFTPSSPAFGTSVTFTATITPASTGSAQPTGTVAFFSGSTLLGGGTVSNDVATFTTAALPVGTSSITAEYSGDPNYAASISPAVTVKTTQATTATAVSFSPAEPVLGQDVTLTAGITPATTGPQSPSGTVEFFDGSTLLGSSTVSNDGATLVTTGLSLGNNSITATYEGDGNYVASISPAITVTVVQSATPPSPSFQLVTSPSGPDLAAIAAVSATDIWAVGSRSAGAVIENFNGSSWSVFASPKVPDGELFGVTALSSKDVWAVGGTSSNGVLTPLVEFFNGTSWSIQTTPTLPTNGSGNDTKGGGEFFAVAAISPTDVWAVGGLGNGAGGSFIEQFNGTSWSVAQAPSPTFGELRSISAASSSDIFAVGFDSSRGNSETLQFNGTTWNEVNNGPTGTDAVDAISATDVWAVGGSTIWNFNGTSWTEVASGIGGNLFAVSGSSANDIYAVGETASPNDETLVEQWNGVSWSAVTSAGAGELAGVTTLSNGTAVAVGAVGIESNATAAAPETSPVQAPGSVAVDVLPDDTVQPPAARSSRRR